MPDPEPKLLDLERMFGGRLFTIPNYQRSYSWGTKQRSELLKDIKESFEKKRSTHFMATIVVLNRGSIAKVRANEYQHVEIVDGQQRLTTLAILYKALSNTLDESNSDEKLTKDELERMLVIQDKSSPAILQTNHDVSGLFVNYIRTGAIDRTVAKTSADKNIINAIAECEKFVSDWKDHNGSIIDLIAHVKYKLKFVYYEINDESLVYSVFELLNSRGLPVEPLDRLKSVLMGLAFELPCEPAILDEVHRRWSDIYRVIGIQNISKDILECAAFLRGFKPKDTRPIISKNYSDECVEFLTQMSMDNCPRIIETADWIEKITRSVSKLTSNQSKFTNIYPVFVSLPGIAIDIREDLAETTKNELLQYWYKTQFCVYGICSRYLRRMVDFTVGDYDFHFTRLGAIKLAHDIANKKISPTKIKSIFAHTIEALPVKKELDTWVRSDAYRLDADEIRYLLYRYEKYLADESGHKISNDQWNRVWVASSYKTIEHILPQSSRTRSVHWLGNLFLLPPGINSKLNKTPPNKKIEAYRNTGFLMAQEIIPNLLEWNEHKIVERGEKIIQWAKQEWGQL